MPLFHNGGSCLEVWCRTASLSSYPNPSLFGCALHVRKRHSHPIAFQPAILSHDLFLYVPNSQTVLRLLPHIRTDFHSRPRLRHQQTVADIRLGSWDCESTVAFARDAWCLLIATGVLCLLRRPQPLTTTNSLTPPGLLECRMWIVVAASSVASAYFGNWL